MIKLHRQFGHCSEQKLLKLIESVAIWEDRDEMKKLIIEVSEECVICKQYNKRKLRPMSGFRWHQNSIAQLRWTLSHMNKVPGFFTLLIFSQDTPQHVFVDLKSKVS